MKKRIVSAVGLAEGSSTCKGVGEKRAHWLCRHCGKDNEVEVTLNREKNRLESIILGSYKCRFCFEFSPREEVHNKLLANYGDQKNDAPQDTENKGA